jgi:hypothetical protein
MVAIKSAPITTMDEMAAIEICRFEIRALVARRSNSRELGDHELLNAMVAKLP